MGHDGDEHPVGSDPNMRPDGPGWDVGELPARPMPYFVFPPNKDSVALVRNQEDFLSAKYKATLCRDERLKRHAQTMDRGHGSPAHGKPYAQLGEVQDLTEQPPVSHVTPMRVVYPRRKSKGTKRSAPQQVHLGRTEVGHVYGREYAHFMAFVPPQRSLEVVVRNAEGAGAPDVFVCTSNQHPTSSDHTWRELGGGGAEVILEIEHTDAGFRPGAFYIGVYSSLLDCPFLLCVKCHEDPIKVPALDAVGCRGRGVNDGYALITDRVKRSHEITQLVRSGVSYANASITVDEKLRASRSSPALAATHRKHPAASSRPPSEPASPSPPKGSGRRTSFDTSAGLDLSRRNSVAVSDPSAAERRKALLTDGVLSSLSPPGAAEEEEAEDGRLSTPQAFRLKVRRGEYLRMQELYHEKLESAVSKFDAERAQTRAFRSCAMGATLALPPPHQMAQYALPAMRTQATAIHAEYTRLREQRDRSYLGRKGQEGGSLFARQIDTICDGRLQGLAAVRQIGRERGVKAQGLSRPAGAPVVAAGGVKGGGSSQGSCQGSRSHSRKSTDELRPGG